MSGIDGSVNDDDCRLAGFERNRYFNGKLMTARDMLAEQGYHVDRANTLARTTLGEGIVRGLDVTEVTATDTDFTAEVAAGVALDSCGRLLVVPESAGSQPVTDADSGESTPPSTDLVYLYLSYDDCYKQTVPALGSENGCADDCEYNRVLEQFELHYREVLPGTDPADLPRDGKPVPEVAFPTGAETEADEFAALHRMARSYYEVGDGDKSQEGGASENGDPRPHGDLAAFPDDDRTVFLGAFATDDEGATWTERRGPDRPERPYVYTTDFLHAGLARHVTDFGNPHEVLLSVLDAESIDGVDDPIVRTADGPAAPEAFSPGDVQLRSPEGSLDIAGVPGPADSGDGVTFDLIEVYRDRLDEYPGHVQEFEEHVDDFDTHVGEFEAHVTDTDNPHEVTADQIGSILRVNDVELGAIVELQGDGVTFDVNEGDGVVTIQAESPEVPEPEEPVPTETRFGRHVIETALYGKCATFDRISRLDVEYDDDFDTPPHREISIRIRREADDVVADEEYLTDDGEVIAEEVVDAMFTLLDLEMGLLDVLSDADAVQGQTVRGLERYKRTLDRLERVLRDGDLTEEERAVEAAMAQELVTSAADCIQVSQLVIE
ncbi:hypothetical protein [Salinirubrum litoreum]|uniref:Uncharacterized protein n=1 Tax=Salinirubrum litoreum TaxID=1126234 RepID=A0ABD5REC1_9EURY|nr:hypothetical protein [Salinirubrum litoreum]